MSRMPSLEEVPELGRLRTPGELLLEAGDFLGSEEDRMLIAVDGHRNASPPHHLAKQLEVPLGVLVLTEACPRHQARGVINAAHQAEPGPTPFQPVMPAGIDLQEHAFSRHAVTAAPMAG